MNLNPISLHWLLVTVLFLVFLSYHLCLILNLLRNYSRCIIIDRNLQQRLLPRLVIRLLILPLPIALCKGKCSCISHPISQFVSYGHLSSFLYSFTTSLNFIVVPKFILEAMPRHTVSTMPRHSYLLLKLLQSGF